MRQAWQIKKPSRRSSPGPALGSTEGLGRAGSGTPCWLQGNPAHGAAGASAAGKPIQQLTSAKIQATSKPGACEVLAPHGGPGITRCCNRAGRGEKEPFQLTQPSSNGEKRKEQNPGAFFLLAKQALCKLSEDLWHFKVFPFSRALLQD